MLLIGGGQPPGAAPSRGVCLGLPASPGHHRRILHDRRDLTHLDVNRLQGKTSTARPWPAVHRYERASNSITTPTSRWLTRARQRCSTSRCNSQTSTAPIQGPGGRRCRRSPHWRLLNRSHPYPSRCHQCPRDSGRRNRTARHITRPDSPSHQSPVDTRWHAEYWLGLSDAGPPARRCDGNLTRTPLGAGCPAAWIVSRGLLCGCWYGRLSGDRSLARRI